MTAHSALTRGQSIQRYCRVCVGDGIARDCELKHCALYRFRMGREDAHAPGLHRKTRGEAIKSFCRDCMCTRYTSKCVAPDCLLFRFRS